MSSMNSLSARMRCLSAFDPLPLLGADDARDQVEREDPLGAGGIAVNVECDAHLEEQPLDRELAALEFSILEGLQSVE